MWLEAQNLPLDIPSAKLAPKRQGPFTIIKQISPVVYQLSLPRGWTIHDVFYTSLLSHYKHMEQYGDNFTKPHVEIINREAEFEVEDIISHRFHGQKRELQYLIKWKGYPTYDNSWELDESIHAPDLLRCYHAHHPLDQPQQIKRRWPPP